MVLIIQRPFLWHISILFKSCFMIQLVILGLYINLILVYMDQSSEYVVANGEHLVCQQQKALYGLKQYHCVWLDQFSAIVLGYGFQCYTSIQSVFVCHPTIGIIVMIVYVGDITFGIDSTSIVDMKSYLAKQFHTKTQVFFIIYSRLELLVFIRAYFCLSGNMFLICYDRLVSQVPNLLILLWMVSKMICFMALVSTNKQLGSQVTLLF